METLYNELTVEECSRQVLSDLYLAYTTMEAYIEFDELDFLFEADDIAVKNDLIKKNSDTVRTSKGFLGKAIDGLMAMINRVSDAIGNFISRLTLSKDQRAMYDELVQKCKNDPELKDKRITVKDWKAISTEYNKVMSRAENEIKRNAAGQRADMDGAINDLENYIKGLGKGVYTSVSMELALNQASSSIEFAREIQHKLKHDKKYMQELKDAVGASEVRKFKRDINRLSSELTLRRAMYTAKHETCKSFEEAYKKTFKDVASIFDESNLQFKYNLAISDNDLVLVKNDKYDPNSKKRITAGGKRITSRLAGNKEVKETLPTKGEIAKGLGYAAKKDLNKKFSGLKSKLAHKKAERAFKRGDYYYQSKKDAKYGVHDPDSLYTKGKEIVDKNKGKIQEKIEKILS